MNKIASKLRHRTSSSAKIRASEANSKDRLFRSAEELFSTKGFREVSVRDIAAHAGVHFALLAYYFGGKQALFNKIFHSHVAPLVEEGMKRLKDITKDGK